MTLIKKSSKVTPINVKPGKNNSIFNKSKDVASNIKFIVYVQALLGINRVYLMKCGRLVTWFSRTYSLLLMILTILFMINFRNESASFVVIQDTSCTVYAFLIFNSILFKKKTFDVFFANMNTFDEILNINKDFNVTSPSYRSLIWMSISVVYSVIEFGLFYAYGQASYVMIIMNLTLMAYDSEQMLFCTLIRMILIRVRVIKAHVTKKFGKVTKELDRVDELSRNVQLDTISLHTTYELLHKCAEQLNSVMSLPMIVSLFCSGLSSTLLMKNVFKALQMDDSDSTLKQLMIIYSSVRCLKYTISVVFPCYYSSVTTTQVSHIRTMLHDAANRGELDKIERRQVKAFFQLTRENEFAYALWGVIRLNMSLPLSYSSLCTTYLVIIIQFSKFID
ncbi:uncharacterized protein LOC128672685 [Plodia interpunctella]|uniref:uncharacterized protein LOC128672685 n=1 Tax=Plodia interpunctella TaxID=58824 RepID=UPI0023674EEC|nr:uncharacterized protein LOC128672685 [Plodia interpunctella]